MGAIGKEVNKEEIPKLGASSWIIISIIVILAIIAIILYKKVREYRDVK